MTAVRILTLSHFRSHRRAHLDLDPRPVAVYGPNGAGKTNILEAVSLLSPGRGLRRASAQDMVRKPGGPGWKITATAGENEIETWSEGGTARQVRIDGKAASQVQLGRIVRLLWLVPAMDRLWIEGADGRRRFLDRIALSFAPAHAEAALAYEKAMRERNRLLKDMVRDAAWYEALEAQMVDAGLRLHAGREQALTRIAAAQQDAISTFPAADLSLEHVDADLPDTTSAFSQALRENRPRDMMAGRTLIGPHRTDLAAVYREKGIAARDCSTGEQKALLVSIILANARALKAEKEAATPLLLLDEVAAHLDPNRRAALYDEISRLGVQAWMTGTEAALFDGLGQRGQYVEVRDNGGTSEVFQK